MSRKRNRREFLEDSMFAAAAAAAAGSSGQLFAADNDPQSKSANERLHVAVVGVKGRGGSHIGAFSGRKDTAKTGIWKKQVSPAAYAELLATIARTQVLDEDIKRKTCLKGRPVLTVMRTASDAGNARSVLLNSGCEGYADLVKQIEGAFIRWADVAKWL